MAHKEVRRREFLGTGAAAVGAGVLAAAARGAEAPKMPPKEKILSYDERMEYRRLGKTNLWVSAIALGGHWKRCPFKGEEFAKNRADILSRCLDAGINYVDACWGNEILAYSKGVKTIGKRDKIYFGFSNGGQEVRFEKWRTTKALMESFDGMLKQSGLDHADLWRITMHEQSSRHTDGEVEEMMRALETAKQQGKARFVGFSSHDRPHIEKMIQAYPKIVDAICSPYTAKTKEKPEGSFFDTLRKYDIGLFGIKPFASNSIFKGKSAPDDPHREEDDRIARLALRYVLCCDVLTAPIPGLIFPHHVENCLKAIEERRKEDLAARPAVLDNQELARAADRMWERLPAGYQWLKDWEWV
ncbi:MAG TPA: aldo/keto reductase [Planctomycetota bacterium]|nr:aldo/keto reductase [Planctomycetota bacterium]